jgi:hypothetical protein
MGERVYCPACRLLEATEADTATVPHGEDGGLCWARWGSGCPPRERPTVLHMVGGETGGDRCRTLDEHDAVACAAAMDTAPDPIDYIDAATKCPAPTPEPMGGMSRG